LHNQVTRLWPEIARLSANMHRYEITFGIKHRLVSFKFTRCNGAGCSFNEGLYRIHTPKSSVYWGLTVNKYFSQYKGKIIPFGFDWMGRQFGVEKNSENRILMFDCSTAESFRIEESLIQFHNSSLVKEREEILSEQLFTKAIKLFTATKIQYNECIGYKTPLFLGGKDSLENYEIADMEVYWEFQCQIYLQIKDLPPGTKISSINFLKKGPGI
jgi:hypothetical protein